MPFDSSDIDQIYFDEVWACTTVRFIVNGIVHVYCSERSHPGQGGT